MSTLQERLLEVFPEPHERGLKARIAHVCKVAPASVSNWFGNPEKVTTISRENAEKLIATFELQVSPAWLAEGKLPKQAPVPLPAQAPAQFVASLTPSPAPWENAIQVPLLANAGSMGQGTDVQHDDVIMGTIALSPEWIIKRVRPTTPQALRFIHAYGDSMAPTFEDGDVLLVDTGARDPAIDGVYVLEAHRRIFIKRVRQRMDGNFEVSSDNPNVKTVDVLNGDHAVDVLGRVVWAWNGKKM